MIDLIPSSYELLSCDSFLELADVREFMLEEMNLGWGGDFDALFVCGYCMRERFLLALMSYEGIFMVQFLYNRSYSLSRTEFVANFRDSTLDFLSFRCAFLLQHLRQLFQLHTDSSILTCPHFWLTFPTDLLCIFISLAKCQVKMQKISPLSLTFPISAAVISG